MTVKAQSHHSQMIIELSCREIMTIVTQLFGTKSPVINDKKNEYFKCNQLVYSMFPISAILGSGPYIGMGTSSLYIRSIFSAAAEDREANPL